MAGRKSGAAYKLYGFLPKLENGKHVAMCTSCNRILQNTAAVRMQKHRNSCLAARAERQAEHLSDEKNFASCSKAEFVNFEASTHLSNNTSNNVKLENAADFEVSNLENSICEENVEPLQDYMQIQHHNPSPKRNTAEEQLKAKIDYFKEKNKFVLNEMNSLKIEKTLMVLEIKKLRLEIEQLQNHHF